LFLALVAVKKSAFYTAHLPYFGLLVGAGTALFLGATMRDLAAGRPGPVARLLASKPLAAIGAFSYSVYLVHNPLIRVFHLAVESVARLTPEVMFAVLLAATPLYLLAAYAFHVLVERPFMGGRGPRAAAPARRPQIALES